MDWWFDVCYFLSYLVFHICVEREDGVYNVPVGIPNCFDPRPNPFTTGPDNMNGYGSTGCDGGTKARDEGMRNCTRMKMQENNTSYMY